MRQKTFIIAVLLFTLGQAFAQKKVTKLIKEYRLIEAKNVIDKELTNTSLPINEQAQFLKLSGEISIKLGNYQESLDQYTKSKKLWLASNNQEQYAMILGDMGIVHWKLGNLESAYDYLSRSATIQEKQGLTHQLANTYNNLGLIWSTSNPKRALSYYQKALSLYKDHEKANYLITNNNIGIVKRTMGEHEDALAVFKKTLSSLDPTVKENDFQIAFTKANVAQTHLLMNNTQEALSFFKRSLKTYEKVFGNSHPEIASIHSQIANIYNNLEDFPSALEEVKLASEANSKDMEARLYFDRNLEISILQQHAEILLRKYHRKTLAPKNVKEALSLLLLSDTLIQQQRNFLFSKNDKIAFNQQAREVYECEMECLIILNSEPFAKKRGYSDLIFNLIEKSKASTLLSSIQDVQAKKFGGIPPTVLLEEKEITSRIASLEHDLLDINTSEKKKKEIKNKLSTQRANYRDFIKLLETKFPKYYELKYAQKLVTPKEVQTKLEEGELFVNYFVSDRTQEVIAFKITPKKVWIDQRYLSPLFSRWMIQMRNSIHFSIPSGFKEAAYNISHQVILDHTSKDITKLTIIPDGQLNSLTFESLIKKPTAEQTSFKELPYLILAHEINYHFSASLWSSSNNLNAKNSSFYSLAPVYFSESHNFSDLPGTKQETESLDSLFKTHKFSTKTFLDSNATEKNLLQLSEGKILHVPTHGQVFSSNPEKSRILLAKTDSTEDGCLYLGEIYNSTFDYDLITLSACRTGLGKQSKGEGVIGLSRAFIYSGAKNIIVSYWKVDDASTAELMKSFYFYHLDQSASFSKSLQEAKKKMILAGEYSSPYYWAPFILIGK